MEKEIKNMVTDIIVGLARANKNEGWIMIDITNLKNIIITILKENSKIPVNKIIEITDEIIIKSKTIQKFEQAENQSEFENNLKLISDYFHKIQRY